MASSHELENLVSQFRYLCSAGYNAKLNVTSENGRAVVDFHVDLGFITPPLEVPPPASSGSPRHKSPSYYRRLKRRRESRENAKNFSDANTFSKVDDYKAEVSLNVDNCDDPVVCNLESTVIEAVVPEKEEDVIREEVHSDLQVDGSIDAVEVKKCLVNQYDANWQGAFSVKKNGQDVSHADAIGSPVDESGSKEDYMKHAQPLRQGQMISNLSYYPLPRLELM